LLCGNASEADGFNGKPDGGSCQHKLTKLKHNILPPAVEEQDSAASNRNNCQSNVLVSGECRPHCTQKIESNPSEGKHNANQTAYAKTDVYHLVLSVDLTHRSVPMLATLNWNLLRIAN
jgi:hypothetical protein